MRWLLMTQALLLTPLAWAGLTHHDGVFTGLVCAMLLITILLGNRAGKGVFFKNSVYVLGFPQEQYDALVLLGKKMGTEDEATTVRVAIRLAEYTQGVLEGRHTLRARWDLGHPAFQVRRLPDDENFAGSDFALVNWKPQTAES